MATDQAAKRTLCPQVAMSVRACCTPLWTGRGHRIHGSCEVEDAEWLWFGRSVVIGFGRSPIRPHKILIRSDRQHRISGEGLGVLEFSLHTQFYSTRSSAGWEENGEMDCLSWVRVEALRVKEKGPRLRLGPPQGLSCLKFLEPCSAEYTKTIPQDHLSLTVRTGVVQSNPGVPHHGLQCKEKEGEKERLPGQRLYYHTLLLERLTFNRNKNWRWARPGQRLRTTPTPASGQRLSH